MDIAALSMAISLQNVNNDAGVLMLSKSLDTLEETGDNMVKMMEQSVTPNLGQNIDIYV
ncbi:YjfB family protein [Falcatimonas sp. MSJ-15]|uniref:YjfB family protein n=1 Tax=Falcatimonas sp. MSJ-15 TaxID=2841515 RepID=UPI001C1189D7|nr:YjfB family protein [Falcatimonas sp. MSJ-15]MBU5469835.1 YjfB family protein [Falcatimonas sp. MSJ-15]